MSDRYELFKVEPCDLAETECQWVEDGEPCPAPDEHCTGHPERNGACPGCRGDGSRRVPTGRMVEDLAPFVWSGRDAAFLDCGDEGPAVGESPVFVEVTDDAE